MENADTNGPETTRIARRCSIKFPDEKLGEDAHQHIRDAQRTRRHKFLTGPRVLFEQTHAKVLEDRGIATVSVENEEIVRENWSKAAPMKDEFDGKPANWPRDLNGIVNPKRTFPSPSTRNQFNSAAAFVCMVAFNLEGFARGGMHSYRA